MKKITLILILLTFFACKTNEVIRYVDRVHTEEIILRDTIVHTRLIPYKDSVSVTDTISRLENQYARSEASFTLGRLNHSLIIKELEIPVQISYIEKLITDSVPYPVTIQSDPVIIYQRDFFWWAGVILLVLGIGTGIFKLSRIFK